MTADRKRVYELWLRTQRSHKTNARRGIGDMELAIGGSTPPTRTR